MGEERVEGHGGGKTLPRMGRIRRISNDCGEQVTVEGANEWHKN